MGKVNTHEASFSTSAIVLAAGMSRRMGSLKQLLRVGESTLLERVLQAARDSQASEVVLVVGFGADQILKTISTDGIKVVVNEAYQEGMGSSLRAGIAGIHPETRAALIMLADQPFVLPTTLDQLIEHHRQHRPQVVIPMYRGFRGNPVLLDQSLFPEIAQIRGDVGCRAIFGSHTESIAKLAVDDPGILLDVDTREDLEKLDTGSAESRPAGSIDLQTLEAKAGLVAGRSELVIVGRDPVALALAAIARMLGFMITLVDPFLSLSEVPEADRILHALDLSLLPRRGERSIVVASRGQFDEDALEQALQSDARYVGLLANKKRSQELRGVLRDKGISEQRIAGMCAPAGLEIGAEKPEEIALSIMAEIVAVQHRSQRAER